MGFFSTDGLIQLLISLPIILFALSAHEFAHAYVSWRLGDPTAQRAGRLTLLPWVHLDPIGTLMLIFFRFGWAKPVPINPSYYKNPAHGTFLVSLAGPLTNLVLAVAFSVVLRFWTYPALPWFVYVFLHMGVLINLGLFLFNLIPVPPLDGSGVLGYFLGGRKTALYQRMHIFGPIILIVVIMTRVLIFPLAFLYYLLTGQNIL